MEPCGLWRDLTRGDTLGIILTPTEGEALYLIALEYEHEGIPVHLFFSLVSSSGIRNSLRIYSAFLQLFLHDNIVRSGTHFSAALLVFALNTPSSLDISTAVLADI